MSQPRVFEDYSAALNRIIDTTPTGRGLKDYAIMLGFPDKKSFTDSLPSGCRLLDIGAGEESLRMGLAKSRRDIEVISINPSLANSESRSRFRNDKSIIAVNPVLPIEDGVCDVVVDLMSSIYYSLQNTDAFSTMDRLTEIIRVLKAGGKAYIGPTIVLPNADFNRNGIVGNLLNKIRQVRWEPVEFESPTKKGVWRSYHITKM